MTKVKSEGLLIKLILDRIRLLSDYDRGLGCNVRFLSVPKTGTAERRREYANWSCHRIVTVPVSSITDKTYEHFNLRL